MLKPSMKIILFSDIWHGGDNGITASRDTYVQHICVLTKRYMYVMRILLAVSRGRGSSEGLGGHIVNPVYVALWEADRK